MKGWRNCPRCQGTGQRLIPAGVGGILQGVRCEERPNCTGCGKPMGVEATRGGDTHHRRCVTKDPQPPRVNYAACHAPTRYTRPFPV